MTQKKALITGLTG